MKTKHLRCKTCGHAKSSHTGIGKRCQHVKRAPMDGRKGLVIMGMCSCSHYVPDWAEVQNARH